MATSDADRHVRELLDDLVSMAENGTRTATADALVALSHAWFFGCLDKLSATLRLTDEGLARATAPLTRSALEHALGILWLTEVGPDGVDGTIRSQQKSARNLQKATAAANANETAPGRVDWSPELEAVLREVAAQDHSGGKVLGEWVIFDRFQAAKAFDLYVAWLSETAGSHATQASAGPYVVQEADKHLIVPHPAADPHDVIRRCAVIAVTAFLAMGKVLGSDIWKARVEALGEQLAIAMAEAQAEGRLADSSEDDWLSRFD